MERTYFWLGVAWGIGSYTGDRFRIRHRDRELLQRFADDVSGLSGPYRLPRKHNNEQWAIHIWPTHPFYSLLLSLGWEPRWEAERGYPQGEIDHAEFIRGFVSVHHSLDMVHLGPKRRLVQRLRIYGAKAILEAIDSYFVEELGTTPKRIQTHSRSEVCHILYYQSKVEVPMLRDFLQI